MEVLQGKTYAERAKECLRVANICPQYLKESYLEMAVEYEQLAKKTEEWAASSPSLSTGKSVTSSECTSFYKSIARCAHSGPRRSEGSDG